MNRTIILVLSICLFFSYSFSEENKETIPEVKVEKKEEKKSKTKVSFAGDVQYGIRGEILVGKDGNGDKLGRIADHQHRYGWNFRSKAAISENLQLGLRLSNPRGHNTDNVLDNVEKVSYLITVPEACFKWEVNRFFLAGGIIPVKGNTVLGLSAYIDDGYRHAVTAWKNKMNESQTGADLRFRFVENDQTSFEFRSLYAIAKGVEETNAADALKNEQLRFLFALPFSVLEEKLSIFPAIHLQTNVYRSADLDKANHSLVGGIDLKIKPVKQFRVKVGFAAGAHDNDSQEKDPSYDTLRTAPFGSLSVLGLRIKPGFGQGDIIFKYSHSRDREEAPEINYSMLRWDIKYEIPIKSLILKPRLRVWYGFNDVDDSVDAKIRPSLMLIGRFK
jgi:hypothetical protein